MVPLPPRSTRTDTLVPDTTPVRSDRSDGQTARRALGQCQRLDQPDARGACRGEPGGPDRTGARRRRNRDGARIDDRDGAQGAPSWTDPGSRIEQVLPRPRPGLTYESFGCRAPAFDGEGRGVARAIAQPLWAVQTAAPARHQPGTRS